MVTAPTLATPLEEGLYVLETDVSHIGVPAVLQQEQPDGLQVIAYASRALSNAEKSYCTTRKELLAVIYGLTQFRQFLQAREFLIRTDRTALTQLRSTPKLEGQQARWLDLIREYRFMIKDRSSQECRSEDSLSRRPCERDKVSLCRQCRPRITSHNTMSVEEEEVADMPSEHETLLRICATRSTTQEVVAAAEMFTTEVLIEAQSADEDISPVVRWFATSKNRPEWKQLETESEKTRTLWAQFDSLELKDGVLYRRFYRPDGTISHLQLIVPRTLRQQFMKLAHEGAGGHVGNRRTREQVQRRGYWPGWWNDVERFVCCCLPCAKFRQGSKPNSQGMLQRFEINRPGSRVVVKSSVITATTDNNSCPSNSTEAVIAVNPIQRSDNLKDGLSTHESTVSVVHKTARKFHRRRSMIPIPSVNVCSSSAGSIAVKHASNVDVASESPDADRQTSSRSKRNICLPACYRKD